MKAEETEFLQLKAIAWLVCRSGCSPAKGWNREQWGESSCGIKGLGYNTGNPQIKSSGVLKEVRHEVSRPVRRTFIIKKQTPLLEVDWCSTDGSQKVERRGENCRLVIKGQLKNIHWAYFLLIFFFHLALLWGKGSFSLIPYCTDQACVVLVGKQKNVWVAGIAMDHLCFFTRFFPTKILGRRQSLGSSAFLSDMLLWKEAESYSRKHWGWISSWLLLVSAGCQGFQLACLGQLSRETSQNASKRKSWLSFLELLLLYLSPGHLNSPCWIKRLVNLPAGFPVTLCTALRSMVFILLTSFALQRFCTHSPIFQTTTVLFWWVELLGFPLLWRCVFIVFQGSVQSHIYDSRVLFGELKLTSGSQPNYW